MPLQFELVTPERVVFQEEVDEVTLPTSEGEISVLPNHIPLVATLVAGVAKLKRATGVEEVAISGGFIEIQKGNKVRVLADSAERGAELDLKTIEEAKNRAEKVMKETSRKDEAAYGLAVAAMERELARYQVARRHHTNRGSMPSSSSEEAR